MMFFLVIGNAIPQTPITISRLTRRTERLPKRAIQAADFMITQCKKGVA